MFDYFLQIVVVADVRRSALPSAFETRHALFLKDIALPRVSMKLPEQLLPERTGQIRIPQCSTTQKPGAKIRETMINIDKLGHSVGGGAGVVSVKPPCHVTCLQKTFPTPLPAKYSGPRAWR